MSMSPEHVELALGVTGAVACLAFSALGSAIGTGLASAAAVGAWKKCYAANKPAPFLLMTFVGAPITQTLYGMILMFLMLSKYAHCGFPLLMLGAFAGLAIGAGALFQGRAAAGACDAFAETGQGLTNYLAALGIVETTSIFAMVFTLIALGTLPVLG